MELDIFQNDFKKKLPLRHIGSFDVFLQPH